jgi:arabinofuranosyltransferase
MTASRDNVVISFFLVLFAVVLLQTAWVCDDAYVTFRTVDNFMQGYGLTWNISERVQAYTHPLWMLLLTVAFFLTRIDLYWISLTLSILLSLAAVGVYAFGIARSALNASLGVLILTLSHAFTDYSTSGLENSLTHLLIVLFFLLSLRNDGTRKQLFLLALVAGLATLNRMDIILLLLPPLVYQAIRLRQWQGVYALVGGFLPFLAWELFALLYYGFPFPNTAYAKLNTGIPAGELARQGVYYLLDSLARDPLTIFVILISITLVFFYRAWRALPLAVGIVLYLLYVVSIGGDFMSGRFLAAPLLGSVLLLSSYDITNMETWWPLPFLVLALLRFGLSDLVPSSVDMHGITDEREVYYEELGLLSTNRDTTTFYHAWKPDRRRHPDLSVQAHPIGNIGMYGYYLGPEVHIIDYHGLSDALLARLPALRDPRWRPGHFRRTIPDGYPETLETGTNRIADDDLAAYYERLSLILRGNIFDTERMAEIWNINTGRYDHLIDHDRYRYAAVVRTSLAELNERTEAMNIPYGIEVVFDEPLHTGRLNIYTSPGVVYEITYLRDDTELDHQLLNVQRYSTDNIVLNVADVAPAVAAQGFDTVRIFPMTRGEAGIVHITIVPDE